MAGLTRNFKETIQARVQKDPEFKKALFLEAIDLLLDGDVETAKSILRDYVNATIGFEQLAKQLDLEPKSVMRMLSPSGNPTANKLFPILKSLQKETNIQVAAHIVN